MNKRTKKIGGIFPKRIRKKGSEIIPVKKNEIILKRKQIRHEGVEKKETYHPKEVFLMQHHLLLINLQVNVRQLEWRITNQIMGVEGITHS